MSDEETKQTSEEEEHEVEAHKRHAQGNDEGEHTEESDADFEAHRRHFQKHRSV